MTDTPTQRFAGEDGIVDETGAAIEAPTAPEEDPAQAAAGAAAVDQAVAASATQAAPETATTAPEAPPTE